MYEDDEYEEEREHFREVQRSVKTLERSINEFVTVLNNLVVATREFRFAMAKMVEKYPELQEEGDNTTELLKSSQDIIDSLFKNKPFS